MDRSTLKISLLGKNKTKIWPYFLIFGNANHAANFAGSSNNYPR